MEAQISASLGAMGSLLRKLSALLEAPVVHHPGGNYRLPTGVKNRVRLLKEDLEEIKMYLEELSEVVDPPRTAKSWMREVRELSYDIEDYVDSCCCLRPRLTYGNIKSTRFACKISHFKISRRRKKKSKMHRKVAGDISGFRICAQEAIEWHERYELDCPTFRRRFAPCGPMLLAPYEQGAEVVIDGRMNEFIDSVANDGDKQLKVVSVVGPGSLGKTTLVQVLYNRLKGQFQYRAFVRLTRKPDIKAVLHDILAQVLRHQSLDDYEHLDLTVKIRKHLQDKRYLIIIDNLWSTSLWDVIRYAFPEGRERSRVITTTQIEDVGLSCCYYESKYMFEMKPLETNYSRVIFFNRVFGYEIDCPEKFREVANKIIEVCGGWPFGTVHIASLLASYPVMTMDQWMHVSDFLCFNLRMNSTSEVMEPVVSLSYNNLTGYLKTCLLYLHMYPEGSTVSKDDLVKQWLAEGFIAATESCDMEKIAASYFYELIDRNFIQPACVKHDEVLSCRIHDLVRDLIAFKCVENNFIMAVDCYRKNVELSDMVHRLALHFRDAKYARTPENIRVSQIRSLHYFGLFQCMPSIGKFKLLRVMSLQLSDHNDKDTFDLTGIYELFHLRYLKIAGDVCIQLPEQMRGLKYLETLDISAKVTAIPWDIIHLPCLLHLHLPLDQNMLAWIGNMRFDNEWSLGKLTSNLWNLRVTCDTQPREHLERNMEALGSVLGGFSKLKTLALVPGPSQGKTLIRFPSEVLLAWDGFTSPVLQRFEWSLNSCLFFSVPKWTAKLGSLRVLKIVVQELLTDSIDILKRLPVLTDLSLYWKAATHEMIVFDKVGFSSLEYFKIRCTVPWLKFEANAMPKLRKLKLGFNAHRAGLHVSIPIRIDHLPGLKDISAKIGGARVNEETALKAFISNHPRNTRINVQLVDWIFYNTESASFSTDDGVSGALVTHQEQNSRDDLKEDVKQEMPSQLLVEKGFARVAMPTTSPLHVLPTFSSLPGDKRARAEVETELAIGGTLSQISEGGGDDSEHHSYVQRHLPNGDFYMGQWSVGAPHGYGRYTWTTDECMYEGEWRLGKATGRGKFTWPSGSTYEGEFKDGFKDGSGTYTGAAGDTYYCGSWSMNLKHGFGHKSYANGDGYEGEWRAGLQDGQGRYTWRDVGMEYAGQWRAGLIHGRGALAWPNGDRYDGGWKEGCPFGEGTFRWADGSVYVGYWTRDGPTGIVQQKGVYYPSPAASSLPARDPRDVFARGLPGFIGGSSSDDRKHDKICVWESDGDTIVDEAEAAAWRGVKTTEDGGEGGGMLPVKGQGEIIAKGHKNYELMLNLQLGIRHAVGKQGPIVLDLKSSAFDPKEKYWTKFPPEGSKHTPPHNSCEFRWKDYCPQVFRTLRKLFKVDAADYMLSLCGNEALQELSSPGNSGSFFYLTNDDRYMIKTMKKSEVKMLLKMLPAYYNHVRAFENTLVTKFFGLHCVKLAGANQKKVRFVIMGNLFCSEYPIHRRFDLKGSSLGRTTDKPQTEIDQYTTLKDLDLNFIFRLKKQWFQEFQRQVERDCEFLEQEKIMDYSLLVGVHFRDDREKLLTQGSMDFDINNISTHCLSRGRKDQYLAEPNRCAQTKLGANLPARAELTSRKSDCKLQLIEEPTGKYYDVILYFGIINILQDYDISKKLEHAYKSFQYDPTSISPVDPKQHSRRFRDFIYKVFQEDTDS